MDAASFEARNAFAERGDCGGVWMADGDSRAVALGIARGQIKLRENRLARRRVVEENFS